MAKRAEVSHMTPTRRGHLAALFVALAALAVACGDDVAFVDRPAVVLAAGPLSYDAPFVAVPISLRDPDGDRINATIAYATDGASFTTIEDDALVPALRDLHGQSTPWHGVVRWDISASGVSEDASITLRVDAGGAPFEVPAFVPAELPVTDTSGDRPDFPDLPEGSGEGSAEGSGEGSAEGSGEGSAEGSGEGSAEGSGEGSAEGSGEGSAEGSGEGSAEGSGEGSGA